MTHTSDSIGGNAGDGESVWTAVQVTRREIDKVEDSLDVARDWAEVVRAGFVSGQYTFRKMLRLHWVLLRWEYELRARL